MEEFDYLNSNLSAAFNQKILVRSREAFEQEVAERIKLLFNLQFPPEQATRRIRDNIGWEFDSTWNKAQPELLGLIEGMVSNYYASRKGKLD